MIPLFLYSAFFSEIYGFPKEGEVEWIEICSEEIQQDTLWITNSRGEALQITPFDSECCLISKQTLPSEIFEYSPFSPCLQSSEVFFPLSNSGGQLLLWRQDTLIDSITWPSILPSQRGNSWTSKGLRSPTPGYSEPLSPPLQLTSHRINSSQIKVQVRSFCRFSLILTNRLGQRVKGSSLYPKGWNSILINAPLENEPFYLEITCATSGSPNEISETYILD